MVFLNILIVSCLLFTGTDGFIRVLQKRVTLTNIYGDSKDNNNMLPNGERRNYSKSKYHPQELLKKLNSKNNELRDNAILGNNNETDNLHGINNETEIREKRGGFKIIIGKNGIQGFQFGGNMGEEPEYEYDNEDDGLDAYDIATGFGFPMNKQPHNRDMKRNIGGGEKRGQNARDRKSENFEVLTNFDINFSSIGGYDSIKSELEQCIDLMKNTSKYERFNVRLPKGIIFEGPPGNGKTMIAKSFAGEAGTGFIAVSGSEFQEKYVGVGASRIREVFALAKKNIPCVIFIDEIDAVGRKRSGEGESSATERDSTLNELLVALDGFKNISGVFVIGATNRADLLDPALMRPGRIDKRIFIGLPDTKTRKAILTIHIKGKPYDNTIKIEDLVEETNGLSGAEIENLLNEAMLNALRENRELFTSDDIELVLNRMMVGWQPTEHEFTSEMIDQIAIHEMGHVVVGIHSSHHANISKVIINLSSPNSPAYTVFEASTTSISTRETLFEHVMILLAGRIAEEAIYGESVTTGAINDFEEALELAEKMVVYYGMGKRVIYPSMSDKYKEIIDQEVSTIIEDAYRYAEIIVHGSIDFILEGAEVLKREKTVDADRLYTLINAK